MVSNSVIFDIKYTPYKLNKNASESEQQQHASERAFFNMTGDSNVYKYITTEGKRVGKFTALQYLQKNTGVFNDKGLIEADEVEAMQQRLADNEGNIWHGFISLKEEDSYKIDTPEKCINLVARTFPTFLKNARLDPNNIDLMCALHLDKPTHLHIHFVFWEKEPMYRGKDNGLEYRRKGKIAGSAIDNMFVSLGLFLDDNKDSLYKSRDESIRQLRELMCVGNELCTSKEVERAIIELAKNLPDSGRLSYGSKDMEPYRKEVDEIVKLVLQYNKSARIADKNFYVELYKRAEKIEQLCKENKLNIDNIRQIDELEADYKRRQGNLIINIAKLIKPEIYERKQGKKYKVNDNRLKANIAMSHRKVGRLLNSFLSSIARESDLLAREYGGRLRQIEEEIKQEKNSNSYNQMQK